MISTTEKAPVNKVEFISCPDFSTQETAVSQLEAAFAFLINEVFGPEEMSSKSLLADTLAD